MTGHIRPIACWATFFFILAGCSGSPPPIDIPGTNNLITCKVQFAGDFVDDLEINASVPAGSGPKIEVRYDEDTALYSFLTREGGKLVAGMPEGEYEISIKQGGSKIAIPARYENPKTSGLTLEVKSGTNPTVTFELEP